MKLQRTTLVLLITATLLGSAVYFSETQRAQNQEATKTTKESIFSFKEDQIQSVTIYLDRETLEFERVSGQISKWRTNWRMKQPKEAPASDAAVAFLLGLLEQGKSDRSFFAPTNQRQEYGFDKPSATVKVQLNNKQTHRLVLGKPDFSRTFIYALADPPSQTPDQLKVLLVPIDFEYAVNRPLTEWQSKVEQPDTLTPSPSPTAESPKPSPTSQQTKPSPTSKSPQPSPTTNKAKPSPTTASPKPSPSPQTPKPSATSKSPQPSPTTNKAKPSPTATSPKPSPSPQTPKPSPTSKSPQPSPSPQTPKPSATAASPKPSSTANKPKPSPSAASPSPKPSPSPQTPKPSAASPSPKPSPSPQTPKPSSASSTSKPSPSPQKPNPSPTEKKR